MKYSPSDPASLDMTTDTGADTPRPGILKRLWKSIRQIKRDLHVPLEGTEGMTRSQKFGARFRFLFKRHGWKLVWSFIIFYLIRDTVLYLLLPYLIAKGIWG